MSKTILIPIDFRVASLNTLKYALERSSGSPHRVVLIYAEYLEDSISELLFYRPESKIASKITPEFRNALEVLRNRFEYQITDLSIKLFHNRSRRGLRRFIENQQIDEIYIPQTYRLKMPKKAFDLVSIIRQTFIDYQEVDWPQDNTVASEKDHLEFLFNR
ncbi:universal stress protein [Emticicia sp. BO119]|uniref:universal stress protein n=1 Tax=Emticicia sp. BO119 TaxID=2757768 RepID=UPI0015F0F69B|nr:universal stress protein [Emticicia sp. BO119]MBA4852335.1 universal stress protein [Emticicia sp. BO119]